MYPIPANATRIRYLESTGTQYVDTGIVPTGETGVDCDFALLNPTQNFSPVFWSRGSSATDRAYCFEGETAGGYAKGQARWDYGSYGPQQVQNVIEKGARTTASVRSGTLTVGTTTLTRNAQTFTGAGSIILFNFCNYVNGERQMLSVACQPIRIYSFTIYDGSTLVRSYVPVRVGSTGCMFDRVTGQFFYNQGTGSFVCGEDDFSIFSHAVKHVEVVSSRPYDAEVEYLAGNDARTAYIQTSIVPTSTMLVEAEVSYVSGAQNGWWFNTEAQYYNSTSTSTTGNAFGFGWTTTEPSRITYGGGFTRGPANVFTAGTKMKLVFQGGVATLDGITWANRSASTLTQTTWLAILGNHRGSSDSVIECADSKYRLHSLKIQDGGVVLANFAPVRVGTEYCLYDKANPTGGDNGDGLYHNKGTGAFLGGSDTVPSIVLASRAMGDSSGTVKAVRKHYDMPVQYTIDECNGNAPTAVNVYFPSGTYEDLDYTPTWSGHRFVGWYTTSATPSTTAPTSGTQVHKGDSVVFDRSTVYARWQLPITVTFDATTNGGQMPSDWTPPDYYEGQPYGTLPTPTKSGEVFLGWFTSGGARVTESSAVTTDALTARYAAVTYATRWEVVCSTTSRLKTGIYSATSRNSADPTVVDWGDGSVDVVYGNISQLVHTYAATGTHTVQVSDNISAFALSTSNTTFCQTTTSNYYNVRRVLAVSPNVTSIPSYAFYYLYYLYEVTFGGSGESLTLNSYAFYYAFRGGPASTLDLSGRKCTSIPSYFAYYCTYLKTLRWPQGLTSIGGSAFRYCFYYSTSTAAVEIPEGVTTISGTYAFANCSYLTAVTLPTTLTNLNNYTFYYCTRLATIYANRTTAPTVSAATFGNGTTYYTGRTSYSAGTNRLYIPSGATGYDASYWADPLCSSTKCGFTKEEVAA